MADSALTSKKNGSLFIQKDGPNTPVEWLGCFDVDDITESEGAINLLYCINRDGDYEVSGFTEDPPDLITFNMGTYLGKTKEVIEQAPCPFGLFLAIICDGRKDIFDKWDRTITAEILKRTGRTLTGIVRRNEDTEMMVTYEVSAKPKLIDVVRSRGYRQSVSETQNLNAVKFCNDVKCAGACGNRADVCTGGVIVTNAAGAATANVLFTSDGLNWAAGSTDPFAVDKSISDVVCFPLDKTNTRHLLARGTTTAATPAEVAYTDDGGATWTNVLIGASNGDFITGLYGDTRYNLWAVTDLGYIFESNDGGATWTEREDGTLTGGGALTAITFKDALNGVAVGDGDDVLYTTDGGLSWSLGSTGTSDNLTSISFNGLYWWISTDGGDLYYTVDHTGSWSLRGGFPGAGTGSINDVDWVNPYVGIAGQTITATGYVLMTVDGGFSWTRLTISTSAGINGVYMCGTDLAYAVGDTTAGTGYVARITPAA